MGNGGFYGNILEILENEIVDLFYEKKEDSLELIEFKSIDNFYSRVKSKTYINYDFTVGREKYFNI